MRGPFTPRDFPHSDLVKKEVHRITGEFSHWSAREANRAWLSTRRQTPFLILLAKTARTRNGLERHVLGWRPFLKGLWNRRRGRTGPLQFGWPRKDTEHTLIGNWGNAYLFSEISGPLRSTLIRKLIQRNYSIETRFRDHRVWAHDICVNLGQKEPVPASRLFEGREGLYIGTMGIWHPEPKIIEALMNDLDLQLQDPQPERIARAVWNYFQAMPYERGSSSIGQAVWAGWLTAHFAKKLRLPDGVDLFAMIQEREPFVEWLTPQFPSRCQNDQER